MKFEIYQYVCANGHTFSAPSLGDGAYGEFLLWSSNGQMVYLNAFEDPTFKATEAALQRLPSASSLQPVARTRILQTIYGPAVCDPDEHGSPFRMDQMCPCPTCGTQRMSSWEPKKPAEVVDIAVKPVTHASWAELSDSERDHRIENALDQLRPVS